MVDETTRAELDALMREVRAADAYARKMEAKYVDTAVVRDAKEAQRRYRDAVDIVVRTVNELGRTAIKQKEFLLWAEYAGETGQSVIDRGGTMRVRLFGDDRLYADIKLHDLTCTRFGDYDKLEFSRVEVLNAFIGKDLTDSVKDIDRPRSASEWVELRRQADSVSQAAGQLLARLRDGLRGVKDALVERARAQSRAANKLREGGR